MASNKPKYNKITSELKEQLRMSYVQGDIDPQGFRRVAKIEDLADLHNLSKNTLYKLAQRENWKFQQEKFQQYIYSGMSRINNKQASYFDINHQIQQYKEMRL